MFEEVYRGKRVLVTGHTGFKGSWLCEWLLLLGAKVTGLALQPPTEPALFDQLQLEKKIDHIEGDIRELDIVGEAVEKARPDFVFHLAAQPIVRLSYKMPLETYATNVMGTAHVLEAVRRMDRMCSVVIVTTDKCYENREWLHSYRECDAMGGYDPYSSSKGAAELVTSSYRRSYFSAPDAKVRAASARAGNVIGGGDWASDRIVPDCARALGKGDPIIVRNKNATRPWQHVLEPLSGYLRLGACLHERTFENSADTPYDSFNFGPNLGSNRNVEALVTELLKHWPGRWEDRSEKNAVHEAGLLNLATDKAFHLLGWEPVWDFEQAVEKTASWYRGVSEGKDAGELTQKDLSAYTSLASK